VWGGADCSTWSWQGRNANDPRAHTTQLQLAALQLHSSDTQRTPAHLSPSAPPSPPQSAPPPCACAPRLAGAAARQTRCQGHKPPPQSHRRCCRRCQTVPADTRSHRRRCRGRGARRSPRRGGPGGGGGRSSSRDARGGAVLRRAAPSTVRRCRTRRRAGAAATAACLRGMCAAAALGHSHVAEGSGWKFRFFCAHVVCLNCELNWCKGCTQNQLIRQRNCF